MKKFIFVLASAAALASCKKSETQSPTPGLDITIVHKSESGIKPDSGDLLEINFDMLVHNDSTGKDSLLMSTFKDNQSMKMPFSPKPFDKLSQSEKFTPIPALSMMEQGDTAVVSVNPDSVFKGFPNSLMRPAYYGKNTKMQYRIVITKVLKNKDLKSKAKTELDSYIKNNNLTPTKTASGLMYNVAKKGNGKFAKDGDEISVMYTGKLLNGQVFDSNVPSKEPFNLELGQGRVIKGWEEGLKFFDEGATGYLLLPYDLAYGEAGTRGIDPFATLLFEIEVLKVTPAAELAVRKAEEAKKAEAAAKAAQPAK